MELAELRLLVTDDPACFRFYRDVLGLTHRMGTEDEVYAAFDLGNGHHLALFQRDLMAAAIGQPAPQGDARGADSFALCLTVENLDDAMREIAGRGGVFIAGPTDQPVWGGRVAHLRDPDGALVELFQNIPVRADVGTPSRDAE